MASIIQLANGTREIQYTAANGSRPKIRMGKAPLKTVEEVCRRLEYILASNSSGTALDPETARWLGKISDGLHRRLAKLGLVGSRKPAEPAPTATLEAFTAEYINGRKDIKPRTVSNLQISAARM